MQPNNQKEVERCNHGEEVRCGVNCEYNNHPSTVAEQEGWEKEFDNYVPWTPAYLKSEDAKKMDNEVKAFIRQTLSRHNASLVEAVKVLQEEYEAKYCYCSPDSEDKCKSCMPFIAVIEIIKPKV